MYDKSTTACSSLSSFVSLANRKDGQQVVPGNWFPVPDLSDTRASSRGYIPCISDQIDRRLPRVQVKRLFVPGKLTSSNSNELQKVCEEFMVWLMRVPERVLCNTKSFLLTKTNSCGCHGNVMYV